jgi:hypothetical protein
MVLIVKLTVSQLLKIFTVYYGIRSFVTMFRKANHLTLSRPSHSTSLYTVLILFSYIMTGLLRSPLTLDFPTISPPRLLHMPRIFIHVLMTIMKQ